MQRQQWVRVCRGSSCSGVSGAGAVPPPVQPSRRLPIGGSRLVVQCGTAAAAASLHLGSFNPHVAVSGTALPIPALSVPASTAPRSFTAPLAQSLTPQLNMSPCPLSGQLSFAFATDSSNLSLPPHPRPTRKLCILVQLF